MRYPALSLTFFFFLIFVATPLAAKDYWSERCQGTGDEIHCELFQRLMVKDTEQRFAELAIARQPGGTGLQALGYLPLGISIPKGVEILVDGEIVLREQLQFCLASGCLFGINLSQGDILDQIKKGHMLTLTFYAPDGSEVSADMNLKGLNAKLKLMEKSK